MREQSLRPSKRVPGNGSDRTQRLVAIRAYSILSQTTGVP